jgi:hypothetical protein
MRRGLSVVAVATVLAACGPERSATTTPSSAPPSTTVATTTLPGTTTPATTTSAPGTTVPPTSTTLPLIDPRLAVEALDVPSGCNPEGLCISTELAPGGEIAVFDPAARSLRFLAGERTVALSAAFEAAWLAHIGPEGVAYFVVHRVAGGDPVGDLVAVPTDGPRQGQIVARADAVIDTSGDSSLVPTARGLVSVGCCGHGARQPAEIDRLLLAWVGRDGAVLDPLPTDVWLEYPPAGGVVVVRADGGTERRWSLPEATGGRDMPLVTATADGGARLLVHDGLGAPDEPGELYDLAGDGSVERYRVGLLQWAMLDADQLVVMTADGLRRITPP